MASGVGGSEKLRNRRDQLQIIYEYLSTTFSGVGECERMITWIEKNCDDRVALAYYELAKSEGADARDHLQCEVYNAIRYLNVRICWEDRLQMPTHVNTVSLRKQQLTTVRNFMASLLDIPGRARGRWPAGVDIMTIAYIQSMGNAAGQGFAMENLYDELCAVIRFMELESRVESE